MTTDWDVQEYLRLAREAEIWVGTTSDPWLRRQWEQIAAAYRELAKKHLGEMTVTAADHAPRGDEKTRDRKMGELTTSAALCHEQAERARALAAAEGDKQKRRVMLMISEYYYLLHDQMVELDRLQLALPGLDPAARSEPA